MRFVVTGAAGFLGSHLVDGLLERGSVTGIDNLFRGSRDNLPRSRGFEFVRADILSPEVDFVGIFRGADVVFHYAAINGTEHFYERPLEILDVNGLGVRAVVTAAARAGVKTFVYASSSEVYGEPDIVPTPEDAPIKLDAVANPRYSYAAAKAIGEYYVEWIARAAHMRHIVLRIFNTYGPRMDSSRYGQVVPELMAKLIRGPRIELIGDGSQTRSFCYVGDHVRMVLDLLENSAYSGPVNVGNTQEVAIADLARTIADVARKSYELVPTPPRAGDIRRRAPDVSRLVQLLSGSGPAIGLEEGLGLTWAWFQSRVTGMSQ